MEVVGVSSTMQIREIVLLGPVGRSLGDTPEPLGGVVFCSPIILSEGANKRSQ